MKTIPRLEKSINTLKALDSSMDPDSKHRVPLYSVIYELQIIYEDLISIQTNAKHAASHAEHIGIILKK